jgi:uncharacterized protein with HEPN domain
MYNKIQLFEKLVQIEHALVTIERRFSSIKTADDFLDSDQGMDMLDGIAMMLIAIGENFKKIDSQTKGTLFKEYPDINWSGVKGLRDILAHQYFNIDAEQIFQICGENLGTLHDAVKKMINNLS